MKRKTLIISVIVALLSIGVISEAGAHRWGCGRGRGYGYGYGYRPHRVWVAPPPPPVVYYAPRRYGYYHRHYYRPAPVYSYRSRPYYGYRRW